MSQEPEESARTYREAAEAYLGGPVEAAGIFQRPPRMFSPDTELGLLLRPFEWLEERLTIGRVGRLRGSFLLAVTKDRLHAFSYTREAQDFQIREEIAVFDRDEVELRSIAGGEVLILSAPEGRRTPEIELDGQVVKESPGAVEVVAALSE